MKTRNLTNVRGLIVLFSLIAMLYVTGCSEDISTVIASSNDSSMTSNNEKGVVWNDVEFNPILVHYDGSWHIFYRKSNDFNRLYKNDKTYVGYMDFSYNKMLLEFVDKNVCNNSYVIVDSIETVETFQLSQQQEGTDTDWEALGLTNPNNPE